MRYLLRRVLTPLVLIALFACSKANDTASNIDPRTGKHPSGWAVANTGGQHTVSFLAVPSSCYECHGKDLQGGISKVSCFSTSRSGINCHAGGPSGHPAGWADPDAHGVAAKAVLSGINGMAHCQTCHGADFAGGIAKKSCLNTSGCHGANVMAAHSPTPWRDVANTGARSHASADTSNAAACAVCHANGNNSSRKPSPAAPAGTPPDCFNNTLCHGVEGHATGWSAPTLHGAAAKAAQGGTAASPVSSFASCASCHGTNYDGGTAQQSCLNNAGCHGAAIAAPHPASPWRSSTGGVTHSTTDTENAGQCAVCHTNGANSSRKPRPGDPVGITGCFNNTLCHGTEGHPAGWSAPSQHGAEAKKAPSATTGFSACQFCHGSTFNNGTPPACTNMLGCHGVLVSSPHPAKPWTSTTAGASTHTNTDPLNAATCAICHTGGANSDVRPPVPSTGTAGCFNNTLCHFHQIPYAPPLVAATVHGGTAKQDLRVCQSCHGTPGSTSFNGGTATTACSSCHTFAKAHPTDWQGSGAFSHRTAGNLNTACTLCHDVTQGRPAPLATAPSCFSTTFANGLGQARTCHASGPGAAPHAVPYNNHNATARTNMTYCLGCHQIAANTATPPGCMNCHLADPQANASNCISCHHKPPTGSAYPDIAGSHGAHNSLNVNENSTLTAQCDQCHQGLGLGTIDHLNRARTRSNTLLANAVVFGTLARTGGLNPSYSQTTGSCSNTYCHGASLAGGTNNTPTWGTTIADCTTCHGYPPATLRSGSAHPAGTACNGCHPHVNATNNGFTDATKHVNGSVEATGSHAFPYGGSVHRPGGTGTVLANARSPYTNCSGCHDTTTAGGAYPVAAGVRPPCSSCHLNMANFTGTSPGCWDCHGISATDGRPNGSAFPNRQGSSDGHNRGTHRVACTICHPFSSGNPSHGWSGGTRSSNAQVVPALNWNPGNRQAGSGSCSPSSITGCHNLQSGWY